MPRYAERVWLLWPSALVCLFLVLFASPTNVYSGEAASARPILIVTAVDNEFNGVHPDLSDPRDEVLGGRQVSVGKIGSANVVLIRSGWGKAHAGGATAEAIARFSPRIVIMAGTAGSLDSHSVLTGDVIVTDATFQYDLGRLDGTKLVVWPPENPVEQPYPDRHFRADEDALNKVVNALNGIQFSPWTLRKGCSCERDGSLKPGCAGASYRIDREQPRVCVGTTATGDSFDMDNASAAELSSKHAAVGVDMETAAVAEEAADHRLPFIGIRVITDVVGEQGGVNLYYCLKPLSGQRLGMVMKKVIAALASPFSGGVSSAKAQTKCKSAPAPGKP
ncbi:MAG TPA: 5'-methylthioadenosine/S-adenosylhomocysteine nucleosidase [Candidatus Binataceae bacterium]|jgi:adenosylhomocysteine nucleosidase|nr:5'-methylthioadenosine/S-adenosylhomocysteine nucleosidase [Candidatus Binataceae bacterium]